MFRPLSLGHHQVTIEWNMGKLHTLIHKNELWISGCSFTIFHSIVTWWWPNDRGWNMLSPYYLKWNKISICNTSFVLIREKFIPYLYHIEHNGNDSPKTGWDDLEKSKFSCPLRYSNHNFPVVQPLTKSV